MAISLHSSVSLNSLPAELVADIVTILDEDMSRPYQNLRLISKDMYELMKFFVQYISGMRTNHYKIVRLFPILKNLDICVDVLDEGLNPGIDDKSMSVNRRWLSSICVCSGYYDIFGIINTILHPESANTLEVLTTRLNRVILHTKSEFKEVLSAMLDNVIPSTKSKPGLEEVPQNLGGLNVDNLGGLNVDNLQNSFVSRGNVRTDHSRQLPRLRVLNIINNAESDIWGVNNSYNINTEHLQGILSITCFGCSINTDEFRNLKILTMNSVFIHEMMFENLKIEELNLKDCKDYGEDLLLNIPSLRRLSIIQCGRVVIQGSSENNLIESMYLGGVSILSSGFPKVKELSVEITLFNSVIINNKGLVISEELFPSLARLNVSGYCTVLLNTNYKGSGKLVIPLNIVISSRRISYLTIRNCDSVVIASWDVSNVEGLKYDVGEDGEKIYYILGDEQERIGARLLIR